LRVPQNFLRYLEMHENGSQRLLNKAKCLTSNEIEISVDPDIVRIRKMVYNVITEIHRMRGFVRLKPFGPHVLYGYLKPKHKVGRQVCDILARRIPNTLILLGNTKESWSSISFGDEVLSINGPGLAEALEDIESVSNCSINEGADIETIWRSFYNSQYSSERRNIMAFHRRMPIQALHSAGLSLEKNKNSYTLEDFFNPES
jgi:hypothetical protein